VVVLAGQGIFVGDSLSKRPSRNCRLFGVVAEVSSKGSAKAAGLQPYDVIVEMDGKKVEGIQNLRKILYSHKVGDKLEVTYYRNGQKQTTTVSLTETNNPSL